MHFNQLVCGTWLRFVKFTNYTTFKFRVPYWFICAWNQNFSASPLAIAEREDGGATFGRGEWVVIHILSGFDYLRVLLHHSRHSISAPAQMASCSVALG